MEKTWAVVTAQARAMTREGWTDFPMSMTVERNINCKSTRLTGDGATWRRRFTVASVGATVAATAVLGLLMLTSQNASAVAPVSASAVSAGLGFDDPPTPAGDAGMPQDMPGMDMGGSSPEPTIPADMPPDMPGMDMTGDSPGHGATSRPLAPVLGTFGGGTSAVLLTAGMMRRKDRTASLAKRAARIAGRAKK